MVGLFKCLSSAPPGWVCSIGSVIGRQEAKLIWSCPPLIIADLTCQV